MKKISENTGISHRIIEGTKDIGMSGGIALGNSISEGDGHSTTGDHCGANSGCATGESRGTSVSLARSH